MRKVPTFKEEWLVVLADLEAKRNPTLDELWQQRTAWADEVAQEMYEPFHAEERTQRDELFTRLEHLSDEDEQAVRNSSAYEAELTRLDELSVRQWHDYTVVQLCLRAGHEHIQLCQCRPMVSRPREDDALQVTLDEATGAYLVALAGGQVWCSSRLFDVASRRIWELEGHPGPPTKSAAWESGCEEGSEPGTP